MSQDKTNKLSNEKAAEKDTIRILLIDDDYEDAMILQRRLSNLGQYSVESEHAEDLSSAMEKLYSDHFDLIFLDNRLGGGMTAKDIIENFNEHQVDIPVVIITGSGSQHVAVDLMKRGAYDYITKDNITKEKIEKTLFNTLERHNLKMIQQQSEEEIRQQKELLSNIISNIPHFIFWKDKYSVYMGCNDNFAKVAGVEGVEDITGKTDYDLAWKKQEAEHYVATDKKLIKSGQPLLNIEETQLQADGKVVTILTSKVPLKDSEGNVIGILGIYSDITETKQAQHEVEQERQNLKAIFDAAPIGMLLLDENMIVRQVNNVTAKLVGKQVSEIINNSPGEGLGCIHSHDDPRGCGYGQFCEQCQIRKTAQKVLSSGKPVHGVEVQPTFLIDGNQASPWRANKFACSTDCLSSKLSSSVSRLACCNRPVASLRCVMLLIAITAHLLVPRFIGSALISSQGLA